MAEIEVPKPDELEELRGKSFTKRVAVVTAIFAVLLAITSLGGNNAMKEMLVAQQEASNQWAYYQAKVVREHLYRTQKVNMELGLLERGGTMKPEVKEQFQAIVNKLTEEEARFAKEKKEIETEAKKMEKVRDLNMRKDPYFDYAEVLLQISIVMASVSILAGSRPVFSMALVLAALGTLFSVNGFMLIIKFPFSH